MITTMIVSLLAVMTAVITSAFVQPERQLPCGPISSQQIMPQIVILSAVRIKLEGGNTVLPPSRSSPRHMLPYHRVTGRAC